MLDGRKVFRKKIEPVGKFLIKFLMPAKIQIAEKNAEKCPKVHLTKQVRCLKSRKGKKLERVGKSLKNLKSL